MTEQGPTKEKTGTQSPGSIIDGTYRLEKKVASGGMGVIMRAHHIGMERDVAIKLMHAHVAEQEDFAQRFRREARVATLFNHPNITRVYDFGTTDEGLPYLVMELLEGEELQDLLDREGPLSLGRTIDISIEFLDGLAEAHSLEVVHRDLKPSNIFLFRTNRGREIVKLLDFGIAKLVEDDSATLTKTGMVAGTASYVSPERLIGAAETYAMDVYSAGLIILEMMMGRRVFEADTVAQCLLMQLKKQAMIPEAIAQTALGDVLRRATAKHPDDRYPDAAAFLDAFAEAAESAPRDLVLGPDDLPPSPHDTTSSILHQVANGDGELDVLRRLDRRDDSSEQLPTDELSTSDLLETLVYDTSAAERSSTVVTPTRRGAPADESPPPRSRATPDEATTDASPDSDSTATSQTALIGSPSDSPRGPVRQETTETGLDATAGLGKPNAKSVIIAVIFAVILGIGAYSVLASRDSKTEPIEPPTSEATNTEESDDENSQAALPTRHSVTIRSTPPGAEVYDGELLLGTTQFTLTVNRDDPPETLRFERDEYASTTIDWPDEAGDEITVELDPTDDVSDSKKEASDNDRDPQKTSDARKPQPEVRDKSPSPPKPAPRRSKPSSSSDEPEKDENVDAVLDKYLPEP